MNRKNQFKLEFKTVSYLDKEKGELVKKQTWLKQFFTNEFNQRVSKPLLIKQAALYLKITEEELKGLL